jgi:hypothetical protein
MKLGKGGRDSGQGKQSPALIAVLVVVILGAGFFVYKTMFAGSGGAPAPDVSGEAAPMPPGMPGGPPLPGGPVAPGAPAPPSPDGAVAPSAPPAPVAEAGGPPPAPPTGGSSAPGPAAAPRPPAAQPPAPSAAKPAPKMEMRQLKVFGSVNVSYPSGWKIKPGGANTSAVFTNGTAFFEVHAPDPKATSAQAIAESAMGKLAPGAKATATGTDKIQGYDAYWIAAQLGGRTVRIVGVDGPTRVALFEHVKGGQFSAYRDIFNRMQAELRF